MAGAENVTARESIAGMAGYLKVNALKIAEAVAILVLGALIAVLVRSSMRRALSVRLPTYIYKPLENFTFYSILATAGILALYPFGLNLGSLLVAGGFAGIVVGLAAQNSLGNVISGLFLVIEQPLKVGDPVTIGDVSGEVIDLRVMSLLIRTWDGYLVRIPNQTVFNSIITNYSGTRARRIDFIVGVHYDSDIDRAISAIKKYIDDNPYCLVSPSPEVFVDEYADSSINIRIRCWTPTRMWYPAKMDLQTGLKKALEKEGIQIPYPQLDLHIVSSEPVFRVETCNCRRKDGT